MSVGEKLTAAFGSAFGAPMAAVEETSERIMMRFSTRDDFWPVGAPTNKSGIHVDEDTALAYSAYLCALAVLMEGLAVLPCKVFERLDDGGRREARELRLFDLLHKQPNEEMNATVFKEVMMYGALTEGTAYAEIEFGGDGQPIALWPLDPTEVQPDRLADSGRLVYRYPRTARPGLRDDSVHERQWYYPHELFIFRGLTRNGIEGLKRLRLAAQSIGLGLAAETYGAAYFGNGAAFKGYFKSQRRLSPKARSNLEKSHHEYHQGPAKAFEQTPVLHEGMEYVRTTDSPDKAQANQTRSFQVADVARWMNVPPHRLMELTHYKYNSVEAAQLSFSADTMQIWAVRFENEADCKLTPTAGAFYVEFNMNASIRASLKERMEANKIGIEASILKPDEARAMENRPPWPDGLGSAFRTPGNYILVREDGSLLTQVKIKEAEPQAQASVASPGLDQAAEALQPLLDALADKLASRRQHLASRGRSRSRPLAQLAAQDMVAIARVAGSLVGAPDPAVARVAELAAGWATKGQMRTAHRLINFLSLEKAKAAGAAQKKSSGCPQHDSETVAIDATFSCERHHPPFSEGCTCILEEA